MDSAPFFVHSIKGVKLLITLIASFDYSSIALEEIDTKSLFYWKKQVCTDFKPKNVQLELKYLCKSMQSYVSLVVSNRKMSKILKCLPLSAKYLVNLSHRLLKTIKKILVLLSYFCSIRIFFREVCLLFNF